MTVKYFCDSCEVNQCSNSRVEICLRTKLKNEKHDQLLVERFQSSNYMGCPKRSHSVDEKPKMQLSGFMELVV